MELHQSNKKKAVSLSLNPNVKALLTAIRRCEGTGSADGYRKLFGGKLFSSFAAHPNVKTPFRLTYSTAAGAYQFLYRTWMKHKISLLLPDFSPESQDIAAINEIRLAGAIPAIERGDLRTAIDKIKKIWASLPGAGYNQPEKSFETVKTYYLTAGGKLSA